VIIMDLPLHDMNPDPGTMHGTLAWVLASVASSQWALPDLLAREVVPDCDGAIALLTSDETTLEELGRAKTLFKTLRIEGETLEDRSLGAMLYAATIAAALARFGERITRQRDGALRTAFARLAGNRALPRELRDLAQRAMTRLNPPA